jgi:hypothetical protein
VLGRVGVSSADVFVLQGFELLLCAEFVGLVGRLVSIHGRKCDFYGDAGSYHFVKLFWWYASRFSVSL